MAENSRKNEFFERESIAMIAITTKSSIRVKFALREILTDRFCLRVDICCLLFVEIRTISQNWFSN